MPRVSATVVVVALDVNTKLVCRVWLNPFEIPYVIGPFNTTVPAQHLASPQDVIDSWPGYETVWT